MKINIQLSITENALFDKRLFMNFVEKVFEEVIAKGGESSSGKLDRHQDDKLLYELKVEIAATEDVPA